MWYHLSKKKNWPKFLTAVKKPRKAYLDVNKPCFCLAPTVWQCLVSISKTGRLYIIEVDVKSPVPAKLDDSRIQDSDLNGEHRITEEVLNAEGGKIPIRRIGYLDVDEDLRLMLKIKAQYNELTSNGDEELQTLWEISGDAWTLKEGAT
jgi:hypothetical protein